MEVIVKYNGSLTKIEEELEVITENLGYNYAIITLRQEQIQELYNYIEIEYIELPKAISFNLEQELSSVCLPTLQNSEYDLTGTGTVVAIIDSGIDYTHPGFRNEDGSTRILYMWDQTGIAGAEFAPPEGFKIGVEYTKEQLDENLRNVETGLASTLLEVDTVGHGTAVAGIACGSGNQRGVAPNANIIIVKLSHTRTTDVMRALKYAVDKAQLLGMPLALNLSIGTNNGAHNGASLFETYTDEMSRKWKTAIVVASRK